MVREETIESEFIGKLQDLKYEYREDIRDRIIEWEVIDSAGFSLNPRDLDIPSNNQPYTPFVGPLVPYRNVRAKEYTTVNAARNRRTGDVRTSTIRDQLAAGLAVSAKTNKTAVQ